MGKSVPMITRAFGDHVGKLESYVLKDALLATHSGTHPHTQFVQTYNAECGRHHHSSNPPKPDDPYKGMRSLAPYRMHAIDCTRDIGSIMINYPGPFDPNRDTYYAEYREFVMTDALNLVWHPYGGKRPNTSNFEVINLMNRLDTECLAKLGNRKVDIGVALAEARKGWDMIVSSARDIASAALAIKRGNLKRAADILGVTDSKRLSGRYLEYTYGWAPLVGTVLDGVEVLRSGLDQGPLLKAVRRGSLSSFSPPNWGNFDGGTTATIRGEVGMVALLDEHYSKTAHQLGLVNPLQAGWELIPFSFIVDWVVPIGTTIEAMTASSGLKLLHGWRSLTVDASFSVQKNDYYGYEADKPATIRGDYKCFERGPFKQFPIPLPYIKSPFSTRRALNAAALIRQLL